MPRHRRAQYVIPWCLCALALVALPCMAQYSATSRSDYLRRFDRNGDGRIGVNEYVQYLGAGFRDMDRNGDDTLQASELPGGHGRAITRKAFQANLRRQFRRHDRNHDGFLDAAELTAPPR